jgi:hypothetical protein
LAGRHDKSPEQIYSALKSETGSEKVATATIRQPAEGGAGGRGQGFKTLAEMAKENGLTAELAVQRLAAAGITAKPEERMRDIANRSGKKPYEVIEILK